MTSYLSRIFNDTTIKVASIKNSLLASENDGDTEDDTHLCRVLRAYYTEKGRSFPAWLPPDPKAPPPVVVQPIYSSNVGSTYGGMNSGPGAAGRGANNFDTLFGPSSNGAGQPASQSLRAGRARQNPFNNNTRSQTPNPPAAVRPLPSQKPGSYQGYETAGREQTPPGTPGGGSGMTGKQALQNRYAKRTGGQQSSASRAESYGSQDSVGSDKPYMGSNDPWAGGSRYGGGDQGGAYEPPPRQNPQGLPRGPAAGLRGGLPSGGPRGRRG